MSLKMTDFSFVSCFSNMCTGYRIMCPPISAAGSQNKKSGDLGRDTDWRIPWRV